MTTYYVSPNGSDANNGLGPDASHATNKPWLTIGKALGASGIASGDTLYIAPGVYRETVTVAMTSATAETKILGDLLNAQGFKNASGVLLAPGDVIWTAYTTNDTTVPANTATLNLAGRDWLTFQYIWFVGGNVSSSCINGDTTTAQHITVRDCAFIVPSLSLFHVTATAPFATALTWLVERCIFLGWGGQSMNFTLTSGSGADYDAGVTVQNCAFHSVAGVQVTASGAGAQTGGGVLVLNNSIFYQGNRGVFCTGAALSTTIPCKAYGNLFCGSNPALQATTLGQLIEDYNVLLSSTPRTNVAIGTHSISGSPLSYAPLLEIGQSFLFHRGLRPFGEPAASSPLLAFGGQAGYPTLDLLSRTRPGTPDVGALERGPAYGGVIRSRIAGGV